MRVAAIIAAGGLGTRLGGKTPKQFLDLGDGTMMLSRSIEAMRRCERVSEIVVAVPREFGQELTIAPGTPPVRLVQGGARRQDSVANALAAVSPEADLIVIHDAARPFVSSSLIARTIDVADLHGAAIAAVPVTDTVKLADFDKGDRVIRATLPRDTIFLAQTPQVFRRDLLTRAFALSGGATATDEAAMVEGAGFPVRIVEGERSNIKVTTTDDLEQARARTAPPGVSRIGTGYDLHRLVADRPLILAGVRVPFERGLEGHSDADVVCHAVTDAVLGAAAAGDIGRLFPDTSSEWKNADSLVLLKHAMDVVRRAGYTVSNVDVTIVAERPKLLPYLEQMRGNLAQALGTAGANVSIKGKTNEGVDAIGRGEAMACHAVALLVRF